MWCKYWKRKKEEPPQIPPPGMGAENIATQSSICTGETMIGFLDSRTGHLLRAEVVRNETDFAAFYRKYGYEPPRQN